MDEVYSAELDLAERAVALARAEKPAYSHFYPFLERLFTARVAAKAKIALPVPEIPQGLRKAGWESGTPLLNRWDFPIDVDAAEGVLLGLGDNLPQEDLQFATAHSALVRALSSAAGEKQRLWNGFLHHEMEPWEEWIDTATVDLASFLFIGRCSVRPSIKWISERLMSAGPPPEGWFKGYCPVCGSLPSLLFLEGEGERRAYCSWCGNIWGLHRLQCPFCDNRLHESMGYLGIEAEPQHRIHYCNLCKVYFKQIDTRELAYPPYLPLEEWTTLHLDLVAQREGWKQAPSLSPAVHGKE